MTKHPIQPGPIDWSGENPGIYLKEQPDGPWTGLMCFFRIVYSPYGLGSGIVVLDQPNTAQGLPDVANFCISDNEELARYLVADFFSKFAAFRVSPGIEALSYLSAIAVRREGDTRSTYREIVRSEQFEVVATWNNLTAPYAVDMPPEKGPTKAHEMYSVFLDAPDAGVTINGRPLKGSVTTRNCADTVKSSAFLAFSETWVRT
ncbi:hypothetical protein J5J86_18140 [Aquabacter sp. L1I39]|uniref:hypothetical protein n=1 Tax=Aquabacter sp. L1I39 TaxID=2820278 RepID=UPI001ADB771E|nr:hypothetical protein [Aquabacter sp. L1I39]QTL02683.1 hypothetical protein J5J86_18140 [Aquabacter sp. L1I39]